MKRYSWKSKRISSQNSSSGRLPHALINVGSFGNTIQLSKQAVARQQVQAPTRNGNILRTGSSNLKHIGAQNLTAVTMRALSSEI
jgi:hypothetical protein